MSVVTERRVAPIYLWQTRQRSCSTPTHDKKTIKITINLAKLCTFPLHCFQRERTRSSVAVSKNTFIFWFKTQNVTRCNMKTLIVIVQLLKKTMYKLIRAKSLVCSQSSYDTEKVLINLLKYNTLTILQYFLSVKEEKYLYVCLS